MSQSLTRMARSLFHGRRLPASPGRTSFRPRLEELDKRVLLAGDITLSNHILHITGTGIGDKVTVTIDTNNPDFLLDDRVVVTLKHPTLGRGDGHTHTESFQRYTLSGGG